MKKIIKESVRKIFETFNLGITSYENLRLLNEARDDNNELLNFSKGDILNLVSNIDNSKSQLKQDLFVLHELNYKKDGFFVEFGATNGIDLSNTHILEKEYNWTGILAEPAKHWHKDLKANRNCNIETDCVWVDSKSVLNFNETIDKELSTISDYSNSDGHRKNRKDGTNYTVNTISLVDLLDKYNAPKNIDYLSIDTEGSEYDILSNFDFNKYSFRVISCEHNYTKNRNKIYNLLNKNGYKRKFNGLSVCDDWYVKI